MVPERPERGSEPSGSADDLAGELADRLAGRRSRRLGIEALLALLVELRPELAAAPERSVRLREVLNRLEAEGWVEPSVGRRRLLGVDLPNSVTLPRSASRSAGARVENPARSYPWVPEMAWAASGPRRRQIDHERLVRVSQWIARHGDSGRMVVPVRERSLEIFEEDDEDDNDKRLGKLLSGVLRGHDATVTALRVRRAYPPMAVQAVEGAAGSDLLVVENGTPFRSALEALAVHVSAGLPVRYGYVGYGSGGQLEAIVPSAGELSPPPQRIDYFGDLDWDGLRFAAAGARRCREEGLPELAPAVQLYTALLDRGRPQRKTGRSATKEGQPWPSEGLSWLGPGLADRVEHELAPGRWLAQEWVGLEWLSADPTWCM